uniref:Uncharacterized protein n=1 Tax=Trichogramma kaykai TaxID=54128 RepID=A0ABD2WKW0_9HYME
MACVNTSSHYDPQIERQLSYEKKLAYTTKSTCCSSRCDLGQIHRARTHRAQFSSALACEVGSRSNIYTEKQFCHIRIGIMQIKPRASRPVRAIIIIQTHIYNIPVLNLSLFSKERARDSFSPKRSRCVHLAFMGSRSRAALHTHAYTSFFLSSSSPPDWARAPLLPRLYIDSRMVPSFYNLDLEPGTTTAEKEP